METRNSTVSKNLITICGGLHNGLVVDMCEVIYLNELVNTAGSEAEIKWQIINPENFPILSDTFYKAVTRAFGGMISTDDNKILMFGGQTNDLMSPFSDDLWEFDILSLFGANSGSEVIKKKPGLGRPLRNFGFSYDNGVLFLAGGESSDYKSTSLVSVYVEKSEKWQDLEHLRLPKPRLNFGIMKIFDFEGLNCKFSKEIMKVKEA